MQDDFAQGMKERLRADLRAALKDRRTVEAKLIRALVAAIDNAEAPPLQAGPGKPNQHRFRSGSAEVERLFLKRSDVRNVLLAEVHERQQAAEELERLGQADRAEALRAEARLARRYLE